MAFYSDRQVKRAAFLAQLRRSEVDRQPPRRKLEPAVLDRRAYALTSFLNRCCSQPDKQELDLAVGTVRLHLHLTNIKACERAGVDCGEHVTEARQG